MILALTVMSGVFAGAEIAVIAVRRSRLQQLVDEGRTTARSVLALRDHPERFLATVQVGITILGATAAVFGGARVAEGVSPLLRPIMGDYAHEVALAAVVALVSFLTIVVGELVPKSLALRSSEPYALAVARPLLGLAWLARPLVWVLTKSSNVLLRPFGDRTNFSESRLSSDELLQPGAADGDDCDLGACEDAGHHRECQDHEQVGQRGPPPVGRRPNRRLAEGRGPSASRQGVCDAARPSHTLENSCRGRT